MIVPNVFEIWVTEIIFVFLPSNFSKLSSWSSPSLLIGIIFKMAPVRIHNSCHGTMLEWCSIVEIKISSPCLIKPDRVLASKFIDSVVPLVKTTSLEVLALMNLAIFVLDSSYNSVALTLRVCTPLWTFE